MNVINLLKNNVKRIMSQKAIIIVAVIVVPIMIALGVLFSSKAQPKAQIALVTNRNKTFPKNDKVQIDVMSKKPVKSKLLLSEYAAIVEEKSDGSYKVTTLKNKEDKNKIEEFFKGGKITETQKDKENERGAGTNILGFITMIILMQGVALMILFTEDKSLNTFKRIMTAPVSEGQYISAQGIFTFLGLYIPSYIAVAVTKVFFCVDIGFDLPMLALLIGILSLLSTAFALFLSSAIERETSMAATGIYFVTSILAGCFISFTGNNKILDTICNIIPQKAYMTMSQGIENGSSIFKFKGELIYLIVWIIALWFLGSFITNKKVKQGAY
ncbi:MULTISPECIES: ABC transporter permease [Clostridium]|uniref:ABC transporter permease n=1 Tax=Clostridium TaxID=1485 RepID=UPI000824F6F2|nr:MULTISPECIES: ABC transporter permease [Clostridium]PJI07477.1 ABC transporter permease [Clostridium sp. CT7]